MSRWSLLKSAISGKPNNNSDEKNVSIHRFQGFDIIKKRKYIWQGFQLEMCWTEDDEGADINDENTEISDVVIIEEGEGITNDINDCLSNHSCVKCNDENESMYCCSVDLFEKFQIYLKNARKFLFETDCPECVVIMNFKSRKEKNILQLLEKIKDSETNIENKYSIKSVFNGLNILENTENEKNFLHCEKNIYFLNIELYVRTLASERAYQACQYFRYDVVVGDEEEGGLMNKTAENENENGNGDVNIYNDNENENENKIRVDHCKNGNDINNNDLNDHESIKNIEEDNARSKGENNAQNNKKIIKENTIVRTSRTFNLITKEQSLVNRATKAGLLSHALHGVDNTGKK